LTALTCFAGRSLDWMLTASSQLGKRLFPFDPPTCPPLHSAPARGGRYVRCCSGNQHTPRLFIAFLLIWLPARVLSWVGFWAAPPVIEAPQEIIGMIVGALGATIALWCIFTFVWIGKGTPAPFDAPRLLVVRGPYRFVRKSDVHRRHPGSRRRCAVLPVGSPSRRTVLRSSSPAPSSS